MSAASVWFLVGVAVGALPTIVGWVQVYADLYAKRQHEKELQWYQRGWDACSSIMKGGENDE